MYFNIVSLCTKGKTRWTFFLNGTFVPYCLFLVNRLSLCSLFHVFKCIKWTDEVVITTHFPLDWVFLWSRLLFMTGLSYPHNQSHSSVCVKSWYEQVYLHFFYFHMQVCSDSAFQTYIKGNIDFSFMSGSTPLPRWPCCLQSDYTVLKL